MLLDRGWRRSGKWLYQPQNSVTCCPQHTIRLDTAQFTPSRAHKQLRRRLARYLKGEFLPNKEGGEDNNVTMTDVVQPNKEKKNFESELNQLTAPITTVLAQTLAKCGYATTTPHVTVNDRCHWASRGHLMSHVSLQLAGRELKDHMPRKAKNNNTGPAPKKSKNSKEQYPITARAKEIATRLISEAGQSRDWTMSVAETGHVLIRLTNAELEQQLALFVDAHRKPVTCSANTNKMDTEPQHKLKVRDLSPYKEITCLTFAQITLHRAAFSDESFHLFKKYQMTVHHEAEDEVSRDGYERFLVKGPLYNGNDQHGVALNRKELPEELQGLVEVDTCQFVPYGAYHQHYRLDGKLIAVAVLDVLPKVCDCLI
jgi:arginine-tRNA-protein transferase